MPGTRASRRAAVAATKTTNTNEGGTKDGTGKPRRGRNKKGEEGKVHPGPVEGLATRSDVEETLLKPILPPPTLSDARMVMTIARPSTVPIESRLVPILPLEGGIESRLEDIRPPPTLSLGARAGVIVALPRSQSKSSMSTAASTCAPQSTLGSADTTDGEGSSRKIVTRSSSRKRGKANRGVVVLATQEEVVTSEEDDNPVPPSPTVAEKRESKSSRRRKRMSKKKFQDAVQPEQELVQAEATADQQQEEEQEDLGLATSSSSSSSAQPQSPPIKPRQRRAPAGGSKKKNKRKKQAETATPEPESPPLPQDEHPNPHLPLLSQLPHPTDGHLDQKVGLRLLKEVVRNILCEILNRVQDCHSAEDSLLEYKKVARLYNYITEVYLDNPDGNPQRPRQATVSINDFRNQTTGLGKKYKEMVLETLYDFGPFVWKNGNNPSIQKVQLFLQDCFLRLGWKKYRGGRRGRNRFNGQSYMMTGEWEDENYRPACYDAVNLFAKFHDDQNSSVRQQQLIIMEKLVQAASSMESSSSKVMLEFLRHVFKNTGNVLLARLKDKTSMCRALAVSVLSELLIALGPEVDNDVKEQLKFFTRYDPSAEVRRIGTRKLAEIDSLKLRFFLDQAFDHDMSVRLEAFLAMGVEEQEDLEGASEVDGHEKKIRTKRLIREMHQVGRHKDKLCDRILWGTVYSDEKSSKYVRTTLLRKWLQISCQNNLPKFLANLDPFQHLAAVNKIMDIMFLGALYSHRGDSDNRNFSQQLCSQREFLESIDLNFITELKVNILGSRYKDMSTEAIVGWLGLCKASKMLGILKDKVIPNGEEMGELMEAMYECVRLGNEESCSEEKVEDGEPLFCVVVGLEICRYIDWEEANRLHMKNLIKSMLLNPIMDDSIFIVQAINILSKIFCTGTVGGGDDSEFDELMLDVFQEVFDARNHYNVERKKLMLRRTSSGENVEQPQEGIQGDKENIPPTSSLPESASKTQPAVDEERIMTPSQLLKLKEKICDLASERLKLTLKRDALHKDKLFIEALPLVQNIMKLQDQEALLKSNLNDQKEAIARREKQMQMEEENPRRLQIVTFKEEVETIYYEDDFRNSVIITRDDGGVISTVEEGLTKGMLMINSYLDLRPKMNSFIRNLYENYAAKYLKVDDLATRTCVLEFMARVAMMEERELLPISHLCIQFLLDDRIEVEMNLMSYKCIVDLLMFYEWKDFIVTGSGTEELPYALAFTEHFQKYLIDKPNIAYEECSPADIKDLFLELLKKFPSPSNKRITPEIMPMLLISKYQGLLKMFVRGKLRDPKILSEIFKLYVKASYSGSAVLKDLDSVVKLHRAFEWWEMSGGGKGSSIVEAEEGEDIVWAGDDGAEEGALLPHKKKWNEAARVIGMALGEAVVNLCEEVDEPVNDDDEVNAQLGIKHEADIITCLSHFMSFLDVQDQPLMRSIVTTILCVVERRPSRLSNSILVRAASKIPITNFTSAGTILNVLESIREALRSQPGAKSLAKTKLELQRFTTKLKALFPGDVAGADDENLEDVAIGAKLSSGLVQD